MDDTIVKIQSLESLTSELAQESSNTLTRIERAKVASALGLDRLAIRDLRAVRAQTAEPTVRDEAIHRLLPLVQRQARSDRLTFENRLLGALERDESASARALVVSFPQASRELFEDHLLPAWANAASATERAAIERKLARLGSFVGQVTGDPFATDVVAALAATGHPRELAAAYRAFKRGRDLYEKQEWTRAADELAAADAGFSASASPSRFSARIYLAVCRQWGRRTSETRALLMPLEREATARGYRALAGRASWILGWLSGLGGEHDEVQPLYSLALEHFEATHQAQDQAAMHFLLSEHYAHLGERRLRYGHLGASLRLLEGVANPRWRHSILNEAGDAARDLGLARTAILFLDEAIEISQAGDLPAAVCEARITRAGAWVELGALEAASREAAAASACARALPDSDMRDRFMAQAHVAEAQVLLRVDPGQAVAELDAAIAYFRTSGLETFVPNLLLERGGAHLAAGSRERAREDFLRSVAALEDQLMKPDRSQEEVRMAHYDQTRTAFDRLIELALDAGALDAGNWAEALTFSERARPRDVVDRQGSTALAPERFDLERLSVRLDQRTAVIAYHVLEASTAVWMISHDRSESKVLPFGSDELADSVARYIEAITSRDEVAARRLGEDLYEQLIAPVAKELEGSTRLVLVPDRALHALPFAALVGPSGRFLVEEFETFLAPSLLMLSEGKRPRSPPHGLLLAVGDPTLGPHRFIEESLGHARREVEALAELYPAPKILTGDQATVARFLGLAGQHRIVYFAGHAVSSPDPFAAHLIFAPDPETGEDSLSVRELYRQAFPATELVMLAGCRTTEGGVGAGGGVIHLARPFLAAGVSTVVGTLWDVEDKATSTLFREVHHGLLEGQSPAVAIRRAQLAAIRRRSPAAMADWAGLSIIRLSLDSPSAEEDAILHPPDSRATRLDFEPLSPEETSL